MRNGLWCLCVIENIEQIKSTFVVLNQLFDKFLTFHGLLQIFSQKGSSDFTKGRKNSICTHKIDKGGGEFALTMFCSPLFNLENCILPPWPLLPFSSQPLNFEKNPETGYMNISFKPTWFQTYASLMKKISERIIF